MQTAEPQAEEEVAGCLA